MKLLHTCIAMAGLAGGMVLSAAGSRPTVDSLALANRVLAKGLVTCDLGAYPGTLLLQGMSELAMVDPDPALLARTVELYGRFPSRKIKGHGSFISYEVGGSGAAYLWFRGAADTLAPQVVDGARRMVAQQARSREGLLMPPWVDADRGQVFIDPAFAVTPFLLYAGLAGRQAEYVDLAIMETLELFRILRDSETGLLHQGRGFQGRGVGVISQDNWSRGNGWGAVGLAALVRDLPATHPKRTEIEGIAKQFFQVVLGFQNRDGLWHQEMTDVASYTEVSGSALLLYGLGVMIECGLLDKSHTADVARGVAGLTAYIADDGSVSHTCIGCLCPGRGTKDDYKARLWAYNDPHAFGAVVLACTQAARIGIREVAPTLDPGCFAEPADAPGKPRAWVQFIPDGTHLAWENDRIGFRTFGPAVRQKVGSGIDVWTKSVEYPIVAKWYRLNAKGHDYHVDRGEGGDFYHAARSAGCGGLVVWRKDRAFASQTFATQKIVRNAPDGIEFALEFEPWDAGGLMVAEQKSIRMVPGTNFFQVTSVIRAQGDAAITVGIGLTTFGRAILSEEPGRGLLSSWEQIDATHGALGSAVVVDPAQFAGFASAGLDRLILVSVKPNQPFTYYVGAAWTGNARFKTSGIWNGYLRISDWATLNTLYAPAGQ